MDGDLVVFVNKLHVLGMHLVMRDLLIKPEKQTSLSEKLGIPYERVFVRTERSKVQKELDRTQRFINANDTIDLSSKYKRNGEGVSGRRFILVDDVCVTGASLGRCATLLISEGAAEVRCFVIGSRP